MCGQLSLPHLFVGVPSAPQATPEVLLLLHFLLKSAHLLVNIPPRALHPVLLSRRPGAYLEGGPVLLRTLHPRRQRFEVVRGLRSFCLAEPQLVRQGFHRRQVAFPFRQKLVKAVF